MESMTTPDDNLLLRMETTLQTSGSNPLVPHINPSGQQDFASLRKIFRDTLWQGDMFYQPEKVKLPLRYNMFSRVTSTEKLCAEKWPKLLRLQLFPKLAEDNFSSMIHSDPHSVLIQFTKESEASLRNVLRPGLVGHVLFYSTSIEASRLMNIICLQESGIFLGSFFDHLIQEMEMLRPVVNNTKIQMNVSMPVSQQCPQQQDPQLLQQSIATERQAISALYKAVVIDSAIDLYKLKAINQRRMPVVNNTNIQMNVSMPVSQQWPQQQDRQLLQQSIAAERQAISAVYKEAVAIDSAIDLYKLKAINQRRMRQLQAKPYSKFKPKNSALPLENVSRISGASSTKGTSPTVFSPKVLDYLKNSLTPELHEIVNNYQIRKNTPDGFGKCPQTVEELYDEIWKHVQTRVKSFGASTNDEAIEELMCKLKKCSILQSLNE